MTLNKTLLSLTAVIFTFGFSQVHAAEIKVGFIDYCDLALSQGYSLHACSTSSLALGRFDARVLCLW